MQNLTIRVPYLTSVGGIVACVSSSPAGRRRMGAEVAALAIRWRRARDTCAAAAPFFRDVEARRSIQVRSAGPGMLAASLLNRPCPPSCARRGPSILARNRRPAGALLPGMHCTDPWKSAQEHIACAHWAAHASPAVSCRFLFLPICMPSRSAQPLRRLGHDHWAVRLPPSACLAPELARAAW